jgi:hypothetical protein
MARNTSPDSIETRIGQAVRRSARGTVFTPATFAAVGSRAAVDKALQRLEGQGALRRLSRGLYDKPRIDPLLGSLWPSVDAVVKAIAGKDKLRVQPAGVYAANLLGLSEQVPAQVTLLTDGASRSVKAGPLQITLKRTTPRNMAAANRLSGLLIQAFRSLGPDQLSEERLEHLRRTLPEAERAKLPDDLPLAPAWMRPFLLQLAPPSSKNQRTRHHLR